MKKYNIFKVLAIVILASMALSYFIPGSEIGYSGIEKGTIMPVTFANVFTNGITSISALVTTIVFVLATGIFYFVLKKTGRYETLVDNTASVFDTNRALFVVITIFGLGLITMFSGDILPMLIFVPFLYDVLNRLGFNKFSNILATIGSILIGFAGSTYPYYVNQLLGISGNILDSLTPRVIIGLIGLVSILAYILVFNKNKKLDGEIRKSTMKKMIPLYVTFILLFVFVILGFINWKGYFGFEGFAKFYDALRERVIYKNVASLNVSWFDAVVGSSVVPFGEWQSYNLAGLLVFTSVILALIYNLKINGFFEAVGNGLKKAFPYAIIVALANLVLVNVYSSGIFFTLLSSLTGNKIDLFNGSIISMLASVMHPDSGYAAQFTLTPIRDLVTNDNKLLIAVMYQAIYSLFLLVSPTSILLLFALHRTDTRYGEWIKYICKYFLALLLTYLLVIAIFFNAFNVPIVLAMIFILLALAALIVVKKVVNKKVKEAVAEVKKEEKKETKKTTKKVNKK